MNTLQFGSKGQDVNKLQEALLSLGFFIAPESGTTEFYGTRTQTAVKLFQKEYGLPETGIYDEATDEKLDWLVGYRQGFADALKQGNTDEETTLPLVSGDNKKIKMSDAGLDLLKKFEGVSLTPYLDSAGYATIGYGNRFIKGVEVTLNSPKLTLDEAESLLRDSLSSYEQTVRNSVKVELSQNQFDALVSFCYNLGSLKELPQFINTGTLTPEHFTAYVYAGGRKLQGLVNRRTEEAELYFN